jgi:DNA-binding CsgD family transcriptional regulator
MRRGRPPYPDLLTPREQEVLSLIREGLTNEQIAQRLDISESGARYHVSEILSKLGVESRHEAAQWRGDERLRVPAGAPLLARLARAMTGGRRLALGLGVLAAAALAVLSLGVAVNELRGGSDDELAAGPTPTPGPEVLRMHELAEEAGRLRDVIAADAELYRLTYIRDGNEQQYGFYFERPDGTEVSISHRSDQAEWTFFIWDIEEVVPAPLDLAGIVYSPQDVSAAAKASAGFPAPDPRFPEGCGDPCHVLKLETGQTGSALWQVLVPGANSNETHCRLDDGEPLQSMTCGPAVTPFAILSSVPATLPTPPILTARDIEETADFALGIAQIYEPEAFLFSFRGHALLPGQPERVDYWMAFSNPDGRNIISILQSGNRWVVELPQPPGLEEPPQPLDLSGLQKSVIDIARSFDGDDQIRLVRPSASLSDEDGRLVWRIEGDSFGEAVLCTLPDDAPSSEVVCEDEVPATTPTP